MAAACDDEVELLWASIALTDGEPAAANFCGDALSYAAGVLAVRPLDGTPGAAAYFGGLRRQVAGLLSQGSRAAALEVLQTGIKCLEGFVQLNLCGPIQQQHTPLWQASSSSSRGEQQQQPAAAAAAGGLGRDRLTDDERWVVSQLEADGEELLGRVVGLDLLLAALICLAEPCGAATASSSSSRSQQPKGAAEAAAESGEAQQKQQQPQQVQLSRDWLQQQQLGSWCWWALRAVALQQQLLPSRCITLRSALQQLTADTLDWANAAASAAEASGSAGASVATVLTAAAHLEAAQVSQSYGQVADAERQLRAAEAVLGVEVEVTGALGFRTKHQLDPKPQLVAAVKGAAAGTAAGSGSGGSADAAAAAGLAGVAVSALGFEQAGLSRELEGMEDDSAVFIAPRLAGNGGGSEAAAAAAAAPAAPADGSSNGVAAAGNSVAAAAAPGGGGQRLSTLHQALLLGWAAQIKKGSSADELQQWQMAPFVEAVLQQRHSQYMLHATARLLKVRHERQRGRTRERSLMQLEQLANALEAQQPAAPLRLPYAFCVRFPLWPALRKELAELYIAMGFVGAALAIYESLDMWDALILCYRLLGKAQVAQELVTQRLQADPRDAKLWCVLGDIQGSDRHYEKAWEVSGRRSARSQRSLGRSALGRKDFGAAAAAYERALALSPLFPDAWFSLGYCWLRLDQNTKALQAFSKVTQQEPEHGEAWNNLAALWLQQGGWREALHAAEQGVRLKRDSWQAWDNCATAAVKAGALSTCVRALGQVLELTHGEHFAAETASELLERLEQEAAQLARPGDSASTADAAAPAAAGGAQGAAAVDDEEEGELMEAPEQLLHMLAVTDALPGACQQAPEEAAAAAAATATARRRAHEQVVAATGRLLKSVANSPSAGPRVWGLLARWYGLQGQLLSCQEAWLKQVRALQSSPFKSDPAAFEAMADASLALCEAYLSSAASGAGGLRELSAARMHLRGLLKQCEDAFEAHERYGQLAVLLARVMAADEAALAAKRAAAE